MDKCAVSVIITTKNEENKIENCLRSIKGQDYPSGLLEIIVVDNNSRDRTKELACRYTDKVYDFGPERSAQRNFGARRGIGKYILYLDADMTLAPGVISECVKKCEAEGRAGLYIPEIITGKGFWIKARNFERRFYNMTAIDCVRFVPRNIFSDIKGFDEIMTGPEDWDFDRRVRQTGMVDIIASPIYHNEGWLSIIRYLRKKAYYADSFSAYIKKWGRSDATVKKQLGFYYRFIGVFTEDNKWRELLRHPLLSAGMYFLRFMAGIAGFKKLVLGHGE